MKNKVRIMLIFISSVLITDTLPVHHSLLQVLNMLLGPLAIITCGILLIMLSEKYHVRVIYTRLVDPIICCCLFLSYLLMIFVPSMVMDIFIIELNNFCL